MTAKQFYEADAEDERPVRPKPGIPSLNLKKVSSADRPDPYQNSITSNRKKTISDRLGENETSRSIRNVLDRNSYREYITSKGRIVPTDLTEQEFPKLLEYREAAIEYRKNNEQRSLDKLRKQKKISPRTYNEKRHELEVWVTTEEEDVKRTRKTYMDEAGDGEMAIWGQQNYESIKRIIKGDSPIINNLMSHHN